MRRLLCLFLAGFYLSPFSAHAEVNWSNTIAVIIGNSEYGRDTVPDLPFAENDVKAMEEFVLNGLGVPRNNLRVERNAGRNTFQDIFGEGRWLDQQVKRTKANVIVYISSHGVPDSQRNAYFVPFNGNPSFSEDLFPRSRVVAALERAKRFQDGRDRRVLALFDSCFSGSSSQGAVLPGKSGLPSLSIERESDEITIFSAAASEGIAYPDDEAQMSALTSAFLQGIAGAADNPTNGGNGDASVSLVELGDYLQRSVPLLSKRNQIPDIKPGEGFGFAPFALEALRPQLLSKEAEQRWSSLDQSRLDSTVVGRAISELQPRRRYLRQLNSNVQGLMLWCASQPSEACNRFASELAALPEQIQHKWAALEDELAWRATEDPETFALDCGAYKKTCAQLQVKFPGYQCLHKDELQWQCSFDEGTYHNYTDNNESKQAVPIGSGPSAMQPKIVCNTLSSNENKINTSAARRTYIEAMRCALYIINNKRSQRNQTPQGLARQPRGGDAGEAKAKAINPLARFILQMVNKNKNR